LTDSLSAEAIIASAVRDLETTALSIRAFLSSSEAAVTDEGRAQLDNLAEAVEHLAGIFRSVGPSIDERDTRG
jgi:hypothetical protein